MTGNINRRRVVAGIFAGLVLASVAGAMDLGANDTQARPPSPSFFAFHAAA